MIIGLLKQYIQRTVERGGLHWDIRSGISRGCPLSPLPGSWYLRLLDESLDQSGIYYVRYMDEIVVLTHTRWQLRRAVRTLNETFAEIKVSQHPDKTFIGRIGRGFDFLDCCFTREPLRLALCTWQNHASGLHRFYEQQTTRFRRRPTSDNGATGAKTAPEGAARLDENVKRRQRCCRAGLAGLELDYLGAAPAWTAYQQTESTTRQ